MTVKEIADVWGISVQNINKRIREMFPDGKRTELTEEQVTQLNNELRMSGQFAKTNLGSRDQVTRYGNKYMTVREIAELVGVDVSSVRMMVKKMFPDFVQHGKATLLDEEQATALIRHYKASPQLSGSRTNHINYIPGNPGASSWVENIDSPLMLAQDVASVMERLNKYIAHLEHEADKLQIELGQSKEWYTVKRVLIETGVNYSWRPLSEYSIENGYEIEKVFDKNYDSVNAYHIDVWNAVYGVEL